MTTIFKVTCPNCKNSQNYMPASGPLTSKSKRCVYCGKTFKVHSNPIDSRIVERIK